MLMGVTAAPVTMATGYVVVSVGSVHVDPAWQVALGPTVAVSEPRLPLVENVVASASRLGVPPPVVNCVAATVTCQPAAVPVESSTRYDSSAAVGSDSCRSVPFTVAPHPRDVGEVRDSAPALRLSVAVIVQFVPAGTAPLHAAAWAAPPASRTDAPIPPASSTQAPGRRVQRLLAISIGCVILMCSPVKVSLTLSTIIVTLRSYPT